ncbi:MULTISPECIES: CobW family GTP-binding protein [Pseudomonas]|uniref:GTP-binding protein n=1 Tax=Pseudomonas putida TaxID=303 RepID=A0A059UVW5_PSEPU|nr:MULTISPECIES: GTP-binding protein [Pseudomonas]AEJ12942.1 cobalamin synthesis protein P47K [Pseudomonas putida S16]AHZ77152.1 cobalamin synthesis protein P47K [Pseudomonas putida]KYC16922.1 cobalamin biosynthesis protein CobW [Pseudomonas sp. ABFPK]MBF8745070.1 GTP-binding protein [Pseudomonas monteilii]MPS98337.1 GTP-binding protein [Pseudomonas sp.]
MKIPVTVLTGYLGAGKTTLLRRMLANPGGKQFAVIVNEFAELGIDSELIESSDEQVIQLSNGCLCCSVRGDLLRSLELLVQKGGFDALIIETTGLANPAPIAQTFMLDDDLNDELILDSVVCVVDGAHIQGYWKRHPEIVHQLAFADTVVLNKAELLSGSKAQLVEDLLRRLSPRAELIRTSHCDLDVLALAGRAAYSLDDTRFDAALPQTPVLLHRHDDEVVSVSLATDRDVVPDRFMKFIQTLQQAYGEDLLRYKGVLSLTNEPRRFVFQGVQAMADGDVQRRWADDEPRASKLVFIGRNLDAQALRTSFEACLR